MDSTLPGVSGTPSNMHVPKVETATMVGEVQRRNVDVATMYRSRARYLYSWDRRLSILDKNSVSQACKSVTNAQNLSASTAEKKCRRRKHHLVSPIRKIPPSRFNVDSARNVQCRFNTDAILKAIPYVGEFFSYNKKLGIETFLIQYTYIIDSIQRLESIQ